MNEKKNRVILITGDSTKWFDQAIFIVKKNMTAADVPTNFVEEAEKIIESYMIGGSALVNGNLQNNMYKKHSIDLNHNNIKPRTTKKNNSFDSTLNLTMFLSVCALGITLGYLFLR